jgi:hypothetical protein
MGNLLALRSRESSTFLARKNLFQLNPDKVSTIHLRVLVEQNIYVMFEEANVECEEINAGIIEYF